MSVRICSQEAVEAIGNRYLLVLAASQRVRELNRGYRAKVDVTNGKQLTALNEIVTGKIGLERVFHIDFDSVDKGVDHSAKRY